MSASEAIARLRELSAQHWAASGPFKMPPNTPIDELSLFGLNKNFLAAAAVTLPALLECAAQLEKCEAQFRWYADNHRAKGTPDGDEKAKTNDDMANECRAALQALAEGGGE
jgi:hypothetical protein